RLVEQPCKRRCRPVPNTLGQCRRHHALSRPREEDLVSGRDIRLLCASSVADVCHVTRRRDGDAAMDEAVACLGGLFVESADARPEIRKCHPRWTLSAMTPRELLLFIDSPPT